MILVVGSTSKKTATFAFTNGLGSSKLYEGQTLSNLVYHTSMADCPDLQTHLQKFKHVYWANSDPTEFTNFKEYFETLYLLKQHKGVIGLNNDPCHIRENIMISNNENNIIFLGCSHTEGGYVNAHEEYSSIVSNHFNLIRLNLAKQGKGNSRSFKIFSKINFYKNQIVVLQLTDLGRLQYFPNDFPETKLHENQLYNIEDKSYLKVYNDKQLIFDTLNQLDFIVKFSRSFGLRFVFFNLGDTPDLDNDISNDQYKKTIEFYLSNYPEYIPNVLSKCIDRGKDNLHWGKLSNEMFAKEIITKINDLY